MNQFAILDCGNRIVFEDREIAVIGLSGNVAPVDCGAVGTVFVAVAEGMVWLGEYRLTAGMYAALPLAAAWTMRSFRGRALLVAVRNYAGVFSFGGPLESTGRLRYIDGCTDTGLIPPLRRGDPCLNALFFPPGIRQTPHRHPSHRVGLVFDGEGLCHTDGQTTPMRPGDLFVIPAGSRHCFETAGSAMRIVAFHPDSEVGPTDESHQMLAATLTG